MAIFGLVRLTDGWGNRQKFLPCGRCGTPDRLKDNLLAIENRLSQLEAIVADGGQLQQMIERVAERKAGNQAVA